MSSRILRHSRAISLGIVLLTLGGLFAATLLPVSLFPHIDYPRVVVAVDAGERDAAQMAALVTRPLEVALRAVPGVTGLRSTTSRGSAEIALGFDWGTDMRSATLATQSAVAVLLPELPAATRFDVRQSDPTIFPVVGISLSSNRLSTRELRQLAELQLKPLLVAVPGVAEVNVLGGAAREIAVDLDVAAMQALGVSFTDVAQSVSAANTVKAVGRLEDHHRLYLTLLDNRVNSVSALAAVPVKTGATAEAGVVTLDQIAQLRPSEAPNFTRITASGTDAVLINIRQSPRADSVELVRLIESRLAGALLPAGVNLSTFYDQSELVKGAAGAVRNAILLGALLAGLVLFVFLRSGRLMLITGLMLPAVLATSCLALYAVGMSFNMMTLGGMAAAVGLVVDDAVVMLEHMMRRLQEGRESSEEVRLLAASEMAKPLVGSTLATIIVFLPLALVTGVTGGFFKALALTMAAALLVSLVYARYLVPLIAARWLRLKDADSADRADHFLAPLQSAYRAQIALILRNPLLFVGLVSLVLTVSAWHGYHEVESGFMPKMDEGGFILDYKAKSGAALTDTDALLRQVEAIIQATPEVSSYSRRTGVQLGGGLTEADEGDFFIRLKDVQRRDIEDVMSEIRGKVEAEVPGLSIETAQLMEDLIGDLTAVPQPVEVKLFGDAPEQLAAAASETADALSKISGLVEVNDGLRVAGDAIVIKVERAEAALFGLNPDEVATQAQAAVDGFVATQIQQGETLVNVRLRVGGNLHQRISTLRNLPLRSVDGRVTSLGAIASIGVSPGQKQLTRENLAPFVAVTARLEGRDLGSAMTDVMSVVGALDLPPGIRVEYGGLYKQQQQSFRDLSLVFVAALLLTALLLTVLFSSWKATLAALATVMLSAAAVIVGLWLTHTEMDISALMGLTMVVGMVTELVVFFLAELDTGKAIDHESVRQAGAARLRPILMSALIAILTLAPLALGVDRGAGLQTPMARAIIFGLLIGAPLVLSFLPAALLLGVKRH